MVLIRVNLYEENTIILQGLAVLWASDHVETFGFPVEYYVLIHSNWYMYSCNGIMRRRRDISRVPALRKKKSLNA